MRRNAPDLHRKEVLFPITCPQCGETITWTACQGAEAWCRRCRRWVKASLAPGTSTTC